ncbi:MAG: permease-like cell division protein FtsX [Synergistota bacterium]|nr:permease-like cell division protein FtsX [Synergistota bacterium]
MAAVRYACRDGWRLIVRHWGMSLLTIFTAMSVFFIIGASTLFVLNVRNIVSSLENQMTIQAYLKPKADVKAAEKAIKALPYVKETKLITKDMALERLRSRIGEQAKAVMLLGENPLPESIEIKVRKASDVAETARLLVAVPEIEDIVYAGRVAEKLTKVSGFVEKFSIVMLLVAIAASGVVLFNTIRISVYSREQEIGVMMMVGATSTYVTLPFVIQGFILGLTGALLASLLLGGTYYTAIARLKEMLPFIPFIESARLTGKLAFMLICCGATISLISSLMAVEKFIRKASRPL